MDLAQLNARWEDTGNPHAVLRDGQYIWTCPACQEKGQTRQPLHAAMNSALLHKRDCLPLNS